MSETIKPFVLKITLKKKSFAHLNQNESLRQFLEVICDNNFEIITQINLLIGNGDNSQLSLLYKLGL